MIRDTSVFVTTDGLDLLLLAVNNAKDFCQRAIKFEYAKSFATIQNVDLQVGGSLTSAVRYGTTNGVSIRNIERAWLGFADGSGQFPITFVSRDAYSRRLQRKYENASRATPDTTFASMVDGSPFTLTQVGQQIYVTPANSEAFGSSTPSVFLDIVEWLADFDGTAQSSFLFDYCFQLMMFRSIVELNFFLKEDQRVAISSAVLDSLWNNVVQWNANIIGTSVDDANLD